MQYVNEFTATIINPFHFKHLKDVTLNRQEIIEIIDGKEIIYNKGVKIGSIVRYSATGRTYYLSHRNAKHFFIKFSGWGIDRGLLKKLLEIGIDEIIIHYQGVRENRYYISKLDDWFLNGVKVNYQKETADVVETYGSQIILNKKFMRIFGYDKNDEAVV